MYFINKILMLAIAHCFGDNIFLSDEFLDRIKKEPTELMKHVLFYSIGFLPIVMVYNEGLHTLFIILSIGITDYAIHSLKINWDKQYENRNENPSFKYSLLEQALHILCIIIIAIFFMPARNSIGDWASNELFYRFFESIRLYDFLFVSLAFIICTKPAGVLIKLVFISMGIQKPAGKDEKSISNSGCKTRTRNVRPYCRGGPRCIHLQSVLFRSHLNIERADEKSKKEGFTIGILERLCVLSMAILGQYSAISFVLAAKSLARFKKIEDEPEFAEKYLVGTLMSVVIALVIGILVNNRNIFRL